jgi:riboflavin kinase / FMN adenylyltransferase
MQVFRTLDEAAACYQRDNRRSAVTVGSFDGIHRAHRALLERVSSVALSSRAVSVAVTFEPHPLAVLAPSKLPKLLTPGASKIELLGATGIDRLLLLPFTRELSQWPPEQFVEEVLVKALHARSVIVGENFRFGVRQTGTPEALAKLGTKYDFTTEVFPKFEFRGRVVSSSEIRSLLEAGNMSAANRLLGRPYSIRGPIASGLGIGSKQTVPTFNLGGYPGLIPANGVYITETRLFDAQAQVIGPAHGKPSVTNVGMRPTFGERPLGVETHLLVSPSASEIASKATEIEIAFLYRLRDERKFESPNALLAQIHSDVERANRYFGRIKKLRRHEGLQVGGSLGA